MAEAGESSIAVVKHQAWLGLLGMGIALVARGAEVEPVDGLALLGDLRPGHPRLVMLADDLARITNFIATDKVARGYYENLRQTGEELLKLPPVKRVLIGPRLLDKSRTVVGRMYALGLLHRIDGDPRWLDRAVAEMRAVAAFTNWNPSHFLDVAEMSHGMAIGYDWFYPWLSGTDRKLVRRAIVGKGLREGVACYEKSVSWTRASHNWNNVCNGGLICAALAVAEDEPKLAKQILTNALARLPKAMRSYAPDGAWDEGPAYWSYATTYTVMALASLQSALGKDFGLGELPGFADAGLARIHGVGPTGLYFNFADGGEASRMEPALFWLARRFDRPLYAAAAREYAVGRGPDSAKLWFGQAHNLMWYDARGDREDLARESLDRRFHHAETAFFRSAWLEPRAFYVGFKGGDNRANHAHLDLGTFVLDALGQRWATDLGGDDYNLPGYFGGKRWTYYRLKTEGQNTLVLGKTNQSATARARLTWFESKLEQGAAIADLTAAYASLGARRVRRGVALKDGRERVVIQDEIDLNRPTEVVWNMHTTAIVRVDGQIAFLAQGGEQLRARVVSPPGAVFTVEEAVLEKPQRPATGVRRLMVRLPEASGNVRLVVEMSAGSSPTNQAPALPLEDWMR